MRRTLILLRRKRLLICFLLCIATSIYVLATSFSVSNPMVSNDFYLAQWHIGGRIPKANSCNIEQPNDPLNSELMKYMIDFGPHYCSKNKIDVQTARGQLTIHGFGIESINVREIKASSEDLYKFGEKELLFEANATKMPITRGWTGMIRNMASYRCVTPVETNVSSGIFELKFLSSCNRARATFKFTEDGLFLHQETKLCISPEKVTDVQNNSKLMLSDCGKQVFDVLPSGVVQHKASGLCMHPLWGGEEPEESQIVCLFRDCKAASRLKYLGYTSQEDVEKSLAGATAYEFAEISVHLKKRVQKSYSLQVLPRPLLGKDDSTLPNIYVIMFDEISTNHFRRKVPESNKFMETEMNTVHFKKFASITDSLRDNFFATVSGSIGKEQSSIASSLFHVARSLNYATMFISDETESFKGDDVYADHNALPFFHAINRNFYPVAHRHCLGSVPVHDLLFNYLTEFINWYPNNPKMAVLALSDVSKTNFNRVGFMDKSLRRLLAKLNELPNTIIIMQSVKGSIIGKLGQLAAGKREEKNAIYSMHVSHDIESKYNFAHNNDVLVTPYDTYVTLLKLFTLRDIKHHFGRSLFKKIGPRNCLQAGVSYSMCPCR